MDDLIMFKMFLQLPTPARPNSHRLRCKTLVRSSSFADSLQLRYMVYTFCRGYTTLLHGVQLWYMMYIFWKFKVVLVHK